MGRAREGGWGGWIEREGCVRHMCTECCRPFEGSVCWCSRCQCHRSTRPPLTPPSLPPSLPLSPGTKLIKFLTTDLLSKADSKLPAVATEAQAIAIGNLLLKTKG